MSEGLGLAEYLTERSQKHWRLLDAMFRGFALADQDMDKMFLDSYEDEHDTNGSNKALPDRPL